MKKEKNSGITLIALVITIIILIILAGVSINLLFDEDGIIVKAKEGTENYKNAEENELNVLIGYEDKLQDEITKSTIYTDSVGKEVRIPNGFTVSTYTAEKKVDDGLVVTAPDGSKFVWIPVENPVLDVQDKTTDADINAAIDAEIAAGRYPMAIKINSTDYKGVLYSFSLDASTTPNGVIITKREYSSVGTSNREPDVLTASGYDDTISNYENAGIMGITNITEFQTQLQNEYNKMIESIIRKGGFYVGRYETSLNGEKTQSKSGVVPMSTINWYSMYQKQKLYTSDNNIISVNASMIWGSTWDQIMIFMRDVPNPNSSNRPYVLYSTGMGVFSASRANTGSNNNYKAKNIYDMAGNMWECIMEANNTTGRVLRGGGYSASTVPTNYRTYGSPINGYAHYGSRLILY